ncbi:histidine transporter, partial [Cryobacterium sp. MLB-32]
MTMTTEVPRTRTPGMWRLFVYSGIGAFMFFVPLTIGGTSTIMLDHIVTFLQSSIGPVLPYYALAIILAGAVYPFVTGSWKTSVVNTVFSLFKVVGLVVGVMMVFRVGPAWLFDPDMGPFLFDKLVIPVGLLVPIGAVFLALMVSYGLLEFIGVLVQRVMRPIWKTPGRSAIDAVASFVGSYSLGLLITNRAYKDGKYTARESAIIATGFSTVSATFMVIVAKTLDLMGQWTAYFWVTFLVTFLVTAITVRIWPLNSIPDT